MKVQNPIIGRAKGSAGGMTASKVYDKNVLRAKAMEVNNPKTTAQVTQRDFFKQVQAITSTVTTAQLRSLFGIKPKAMSRRNALAAQIAEAYSVNGTTKSVDFSKLGAIGNGEKVDTHIKHCKMEDGVTIYDTSIDKLNVDDLNTTTLVFVVFNVTSQSIYILKTEYYANSNVLSDAISIPFADTDEVFIYPTCAVGGGNVYLRGFGSFIIKVRKEKTGSSINKGSADTSVSVTLEGSTTDSAMSLDFTNYDFNNLIPGTLYQQSGESTTILMDAEGWIEGADNKWTGDLLDNYNATLPTFLNIMQGENLVQAVPVTVTVG